MNLHNQISTIGTQALDASRKLNLLNSRKKNLILEAMAAELEARTRNVIEANKKDLEEARNAGLSPSMIDRLRLNEVRIEGMLRGLHSVATLKDPIGSRLCRWIRPNGLEIVKQRVPIGVIAIIYESRPNVTCDSAGLCFKTGNAVILRGGKEAIHSNRAIAEALSEGGRKKGLPEHAIQLIQTTDRDAVRELVQLEGTVDLVIPRGGEGLIRAVTDMARVPVIKHYKGICHTYIDKDADMEMALDVAVNAKCQRPGVCNAMETLLVHEDIAAVYLPRLAAAMKEQSVELRGDADTRNLLPDIQEAVEDDWSAEYLDLTLAIRIVPSVDEAIQHINHYGSHHSDAIISRDEAAVKRFMLEVDSATVYVNASTRFTDGGEFGMGAEIGISTDKLHARGPMGLDELTTYKYLVYGKGQIRE